MGRWSQARRTGGGPSVLNEMIEASIDESNTISIVWKLPLTPASITETALFALPSGFNGLQSLQVTSNNLLIEFSGVIISDTSVVYQGNDPGFRTPQTIQIT